MGEVVNLRGVRKRAKRAQDAQRADANRLAFGQPKQARDIEELRQAKSRRDLDGHRIDNGDGQ